MSFHQNFVAFFFSLFFFCGAVSAVSYTKEQPSSFLIPLTAPDYFSMWNESISAHKPELHQFFASWAKDLEAQTGIPYFLELVGLISYFLMPFYHDQEFVEEVRAVADIAEISQGQLFFYNFMYEFYDYKSCTSVLVSNEEELMFHARNLDYGLSVSMVPLMFHGYFQDAHNNTVFEADIISGFIGFSTVIKMGEFSVTLNERDNSTFAENIINVFTKSADNAPLVIRRGVEQSKDFNEAVEFYKSVPMLSSAYIIVGGNRAYQGAVLARNSDSLKNITFLEEEGDRWFLVQTNYDADEPDPADDYRRVPCEEKIKAIGKGITPNQLFGILQESPSFEKGPSIWTLSTDVMISETMEFNSSYYHWSS